MKFILGEKIAMTQLWQGEDVRVVTKIKTGPCVVLQLKTKDRDGYEAVQVGFGSKKAKNITKSLKGHFNNLGTFRYVKEFRLDKSDGKIVALKKGDQILAETFEAGDMVKLTGTSIGKGFAGVVKRHHFHGQSATHGTKDQIRMPGSIGAGGVQRVFKGKRMAGRMGGDQVTLPSVRIIEVNQAENYILVEGGVPGARHAMVMLSAKGDLKIAQSAPVEEVTPVTVETEAVTDLETVNDTAEQAEVTPEISPEAEASK